MTADPSAARPMRAGQLTTPGPVTAPDPLHLGAFSGRTLQVAPPRGAARTEGTALGGPALAAAVVRRAAAATVARTAMSVEETRALFEASVQQQGNAGTARPDQGGTTVNSTTNGYPGGTSPVPPAAAAPATLGRAQLEEIVETVIDRIERRVVDELERRGLHHGSGGF